MWEESGSLGTEGGFAALLLGRVAASATSHSAWEAPGENVPNSLCIEHPLDTRRCPLELTQFSGGLKQK